MKRLEFAILTGHVSAKWVFGGNIASFGARGQPAYNAISISINLLFWTFMVTYRTFLKKADVRKEKRGTVSGTYNPNHMSRRP